MPFEHRKCDANFQLESGYAITQILDSIIYFKNIIFYFEPRGGEQRAVSTEHTLEVGKVGAGESE